MLAATATAGASAVAVTTAVEEHEFRLSTRGG